VDAGCPSKLEVGRATENTVDRSREHPGALLGEKGAAARSPPKRFRKSSRKGYV